MKQFILPLLACLLSALPAHSQDKMEQMVARLKAFGTSLAQEQVFLHMDNNCYYLGDTIYYKAYVSRSDTGHPTDLSGVLYCELLNNDGYLVERQIIPLERGEGHGNFALTDTTLYSGYYELRAYTRWQLNWGITEQQHSKWSEKYFFNESMARDYYRDYEKLYSRVFPVYDRPRTSGDYVPDMSLRPLAEYHKVDDKKETHVQFFPEGGNLVAGLAQRVAWEARDEQGQDLEGTLTLALPNGEEIVSQTIDRGRGVFELTAPEGVSLVATFTPNKGEAGGNPMGAVVGKARLPRAQRNGVALRVETDTAHIALTWQAADTAAQEVLGLTILRDGVLQHFLRLDSSEVDFRPTQAGVYQVTVFNQEGRVYADRLVFFLPKALQMQNVGISVDANETHAPFAPISLQLQGTPGASLSLAVRDAARSEYIYDTGTMLTERLLSSQIRGFVPHPQWYFQKDEPHRRQALDLLLMVQGWRRYTWRQMAVPGEFTVSHMPEGRYPHWTGQVHNYSTPMALNDYEHAAREQAEGSGDAMNEGDQDRTDQESDPWTNAPESEYSGDEAAERAEEDHDGMATSGRDRFNEKEHNLRRPVVLHAEFSQPRNEGVDGEMQTQGTFQLDFPRYYEDFNFFLGASDSSKWKDGRPPIWTQNGKTKQGEIDYPEFYVKLNPIYPRFPKPYDYYQEHLAPMPKESPLYNAMDEQIRMLAEVSVGARRGGARNFRYWRPAFVIDAYEAFNATCEAGLAPGCFLGRARFVEDVARTYLGDMGTNERYDISIRFNGKAFTERTQMQRSRQQTDIPGGGIPDDESFSLNTHRRNKYNYMWNLDRVVIYTDFAPRNARRDVGGNRARPKVTVDLYIFEDDAERLYYQNRHWRMRGFSIPDEFYSPDYSRQPLPQADHRRTLYWNPSIRLDEQGQATFTFYNNSSRTLLQVTAEGWSATGEPQCGSVN